MPRAKINKQLFERKKGIRLDIGCGLFKQKGFVGLDMVRHKNVDIVHDVQKFPWPVPDNICYQILMSHLWEHIEPKYRFAVMDELWRICRHDGQLFISCPYANSFLAHAHPAHYMCPNEAAFQFFDPDYYLWHSCSYKKPLPWKIISCNFNLGGNIEVIFEPRKNRKGRPIMPANDGTKVNDAVKVQIKEKNKDGRQHDNDNQKRDERESTK